MANGVFMYKDFYNLRERPFSKTPDPRFLYLSRPHEDALMMLQDKVQKEKNALIP